MLSIGATEQNINSKGKEMLKKFEVENFKGFKDNLIFDLSAREHTFNSHLIKNGIVNKALVYGKNGTGKSNLGIALFDIVIHLTDKEKLHNRYLQNYRNYNSLKTYSKFVYTFMFENKEVVYEYKKTNPFSLVSELLKINGEIVLYFDYIKKESNIINKNMFGDLNFDVLVDNKLSVIKFIYSNTPTNTIAEVTKLVKFCENMLWYRGLSDGNTYAGFSNGDCTLVDRLYEKNKLKDFERFLNENELNYKLKFETNSGNHELYAVFDYGKTHFTSIASNGTMSLFLFYIWSISAFNNLSLLFIDEFDAFFHYEAAERIVKQLNQATEFQTVLTSHNTYLMKNELTRPDCCFIMTDNKITSLYNSTDKEIREAHNLEKMYINGVFRD